jgi:putative FmdB family regulatory protein
MPIFKYNCEKCEEITTVMHMIGDNLLTCPHCNEEGHMTRLLNKPYITKKKENPNNVGDLTKKFIEENREVLEQQKKEIKEQTYDES